MKKGSNIFYRKDTGKILFIDGDKQGALSKHQETTVQWVSELRGVDPSLVKVKKLAFGEYDVMREGTFPLIFDQKTQSFICTDSGGYYSVNSKSIEGFSCLPREKLIEIYNGYYKENLENLFKSEETGIRFEWLDLDQLAVREEVLDFSWYNYFEDDYILESFEDRTLLARDILKNGTYWPIVAEEEEGRYVVWEGSHRIISSKLLKAKGEWPGRKFLTIVIDEPISEFQVGKKVFELTNCKTAHAPSTVKFYDFDFRDKKNGKALEKAMKRRNMRFSDDEKDIVSQDIFTVSELLLSTQQFPMWLRDQFFEWKELGDPVDPMSEINDQEAFFRWRDRCLNTSKESK